MNKTELIKEFAKATETRQTDAKVALEKLQEVVFEALKNKEEVKVFDGVTLYSVYKEAHEARDPRTGDTIQVAGKYVPKVKLGKAIKDLVL